MDSSTKYAIELVDYHYEQILRIMEQNGLLRDELMDVIALKEDCIDLLNAKAALEEQKGQATLTHTEAFAHLENESEDIGRKDTTAA